MAREHVKAGHETYVITSDRNFPHPDYNNSAKSLYGEKKIGVGWFSHNNISIIRLPALINWRTRVWLKGLHKTLNQIHPDLVISHSVLDFNTMRILLRNYKFRFIVDEHQLLGQVDKSLLGRFSYFIFRILFLKILLRKAEKIIAISEGCIPTLNKYFGIPIERVELIPLGADNELFKFSKERRFLFRKKHSIDDDTIVIIYTGKLYEQKKAHIIIEAVNKLKTKKKIHLLFIGNIISEYQNMFAQSVQKLKYPYTHLPFLKQDGLISAFCAADIAVWPGAATISTLEACSCGLPIICTDDLRERYKYNNGIGIKFGNVNELKNAFQFLITNEDKRKEMGRRSAEYIKNELSWKKITERFIR